MNKNFLKALITGIFLYDLTTGIGYAEDLDSLVIHCLEFAEVQLTHTVAEMPDSMWYPYRTVEEGTPQ